MGHFIYKRDNDMPIWRVFRKADALSLFSGDGLYLSRPQNWDDPFENLLLKQKYHVACTTTRVEPSKLFDLFFGQCWCRERVASDATWKIYAPDKVGIRVQTTVRKLYAVLDAAFEGTSVSFFYVCRVDYLPADVIQKQARLDMETLNAVKDYSGETILALLSVKRPEFEHEKEVRILYRDILGKTSDDDDHIIIPVAPEDFIEDIVADPRMDKAEYDAFEAHVSKLLPLVTIQQSDLYQLPDDISIPIYLL